MLAAGHRNLELPKTSILSCLPGKSKLFVYNLFLTFVFVFIFPQYSPSRFSESKENCFPLSK